MKIYFSNVNFGSNSGPNSFANRLANCFQEMGHDIVEDNKKEYDVFERKLKECVFIPLE